MKQASAPAAASPAKPAVSNRRPVKPKPPATSAARSASKAAPKARPTQGAMTKARKAAKPTPATSTVAAVAAAPVAQDKPAKPPKIRLVRDSFTMPEADFALVAVLKARALGLGRAVKKSELLRAGLQMLSQQEAPALLSALDRLQPIKTGRPKQGD